MDTATRYTHMLHYLKPQIHKTVLTQQTLFNGDFGMFQETVKCFFMSPKQQSVHTGHNALISVPLPPFSIYAVKGIFV